MKNSHLQNHLRFSLLLTSFSIKACKILTVISFTCLSTFVFSQKNYQKKFYKNGQLKEEGWVNNHQKVGYWLFYYGNGTIKKKGSFKNNLAVKYWYFYAQNSLIEKEGHFIKGIKNNWWLFYDKNGSVHHKCQLKNNKKNGYCLMYNHKELVSASKYHDGKKIKEWTNFSSFRKENNLFDLK